MGQTPLPISKYVLFVQEPVDDQTTVTRDPDTGTLTLGEFQTTARFVSSSMPFPTPNVGDEIELAFVDTAEANKPAGPRTKRIVTQVIHRIEASLDEITCIMTVRTRRG